MREDEGRTPVADIAAGYQAAIVRMLVERALQALEVTGAKHLLVGGGVAANSLLQARLREAGERGGFEALFPPPSLCTDNAAMIAAVGHSLLEHGNADGLDLETFARSPLTETPYS